MRYFLYVNGIDGSMMQRIGCTCDRCQDQGRTANPSVSFVALNDAGETIYHVLFDVGFGVTKSLVHNPYLAGDKVRLDWVALTHWHPDHMAGLRHLVRGWQTSQSSRGLPETLPPVYCRTTTSTWIKHQNPDWERFFNPVESGEAHKPGTVLDPIPIDLPGVTITPLTTSHQNADFAPADRENKRKTYATSSYCIETPTGKCLLLWDVDTRNSWLYGENIDPATRHLIQNPTVAFFDCTTWDAHYRHKKHYSHTCFTQIMKFAHYIQPGHTYLTHLGGHFDGVGNLGYGFTDAQWQREARRVWHEQNLFGNIHVPRIGQIIPL